MSYHSEEICLAENNSAKKRVIYDLYEVFHTYNKS